MTPCPICNSTSVELLEPINVFEQHQSYPLNPPELRASLDSVMSLIATSYQMTRCASCTLEYSDPMIAPSAQWYDLAYGGLSLYPSVRWEYKHVLSLQPSPSHVIDIGCGSGAFLEFCQSNNVPATGLDHSPAAIASCRLKKLNSHLIDATLEQHLHQLPKGNCLTAFHVLEHLSDPKSLFAVASLSTSAKSHLWVTIPSNNRFSRYFGRSDFLDQPPHHLTRWNPKSLEQVAHGTGWKLEKIHYEPIPLRFALWAIATYDHSTPVSTLPKWFERALRWSRYPKAFAKRFTRHHALSGFSMMAEYTQI